MSESPYQLIIVILLATQTSIVGIASALLFGWLRRQEDSVARAHIKIDDHLRDHSQLTK